jgi:steroid Delta-isomerase
MEYSDKVAVVNRYVEAFDESDMEIIREIYADDAVVEDPVGTDPHVGIDAVCAFYEGALGSGAKLVVTGPVRSAANTAAFPFQVQMGEMKIDIIDIFEFNDEGKVTSMKAYWGPDNM